MLKWIETTGRSEEDAIAAALFQLGLDRDDVSVEVIERAKSGFLGFGSNLSSLSLQRLSGRSRVRQSFGVLSGHMLFSSSASAVLCTCPPHY